MLTKKQLINSLKISGLIVAGSVLSVIIVTNTINLPFAGFSLKKGDFCGS